MPRKSRIEFPGAVYHVLSRGNYRKDLFVDEKTTESFEDTMFEAVERCGWKLFAYVIMRNHYHLAVETPEPNLVAGMRWLQGTFATRFNRFRGERGHVFEGRYKSILVEEDRPLLGLIDYIHLNPVRAGICEVGQLRNYRFSSFPKYLKRKVRPSLDRSCVLSLCGLPDTLPAMREYQKRLEVREEADPERRDELAGRYARGWFLGSKTAKKGLMEELAKSSPGVDWEGVDLKELNERRWEGIVAAELARRGIRDEEIPNSPKGAAWKVEIARRLRRETTAGNPWIAERLKMGHPNYVSNLVNRT
jgi:REP element-mobilizing transposase RayT